MEDKTKEQLIEEIELLRRQVAELEKERAKHKRAEEEIKAKSQFWESLIEQSPLPTFVIDPEGICVTVNKAFLKAYNVPKKEMVLGRNALTEPANVRQGVVKYIKEALSGKIVETPEIEFISPYEKKRTVTKSKLFPIFDATNKLTNVVVIHEDITTRKRAEEALRKAHNELERRVEERTAELLKSNEQLTQEIAERKKAEEALRSSEERLRIFFEFAPDACYLSDLKGNFVDGNKAAEEITGYKREELIEKSFLKLKLLPSKQVPKAAVLLAKNALRQSTGPDEFTLNRKDGSQVSVEIRTFPVRIKNQTLALGSARDITERKRAEDELRKERDKAQKYLDVANTIIVVIDSDQKVRLINQKGCKVLGYKEEEILDKNWYDTFVPERIRDEVKAVSAKLMAGKIKPVEYFENPVLTKSGEERLIAWHNAVLKDKEGNIIATLSSGEDITERKRSEEERARLSHDLLKRVKELRCFYSLDIAVEESRSIDEFLNRVVSLIPLAMQYPELARSGITFRSHKYQSKDFTESKHNISADIKVAGRVVGSLGVYYSEERPFLKEEVDLVTGLAERIGKVVEKTEVEETLQENEKRFRALIENSSDIIQVIDSEGVIRYVSPSIQRILGYRPEELIGRPSVDFVHPDDLPIVARGFKEAFEKPEVPQVTVCRCKHKDGTWRLIEGIGANQLGNPAVNGFISNMHDITERKRAEEQLERSFIDLAETVSRAVGSRDPYTSGHQRRVAKLARLVGKKMRLDKDRLMGLYIGGLLHDIGKISTPEVILSKSGKLAEEEWALIHAHARRGYEILDGSQFPWPVAEMALHHHERMDGSGYPDGISGDELSLENRILGVCDVVEAMSSFRPYRPARSLPEILKELSSGRGTKYDPAVVDVMLELIGSGEFEIGKKGEFE